MPSFHFFCGKGGVGKTTCAAARAVTDAARGRDVLIVSTDPAHSLGDALAVRLSARPKRLALPRAAATPRRRGRLRAVELDAAGALRRWLARNGSALADIVEHGTWLDRGDVEALLDLALPGVDELLALIEIVRLAASMPAPDVVVVDTAPTGHTLRLLAAPETVTAVAGVLDALEEDHRVIRRQFARTGRVEAADRLIALVREQAHDASSTLRGAATVFHWVSLPEPLSVAESVDGIAALERVGIAVGGVIVNRMLPSDVPCRVCDRRRHAERRELAEIARNIARGRELHVVESAIAEPRGIAALASIGRTLTAKPPTRLRSPRGEGRKVTGAAYSLAKTVKARGHFDGIDDVRLLFVAGKGGVGKTTVAAAIALRQATAAPHRRVHLMSTDPAHSLGDVLTAAVDDASRAVAGAPSNLTVREVDAGAQLAARRAALEQALDDVTASVGAAALAGGASRLLDLAPPGIDELFGMLSVLEALGDRSGPGRTTVVVDTAPTGHALRLLAMPDAAREWIQALLRVMLKYRELARPGRLAAELVDLSKSIRDLQTLLRNPVETRVIVVTRPAAVPRVETERLVRRLARLKLAVAAVVVNACTLDPGQCRRCVATAAAERREVRRMQSASRRGRARCAIIQTPLSAPPPRGAAALARWAATWLR